MNVELEALAKNGSWY